MTDHKQLNRAWIIAWCALVAVIEIMIWITGANYGQQRLTIFISLILSQLLGALLLFQFLQGWKR